MFTELTCSGPQWIPELCRVFGVREHTEEAGRVYEIEVCLKPHMQSTVTIQRSKAVMDDGVPIHGCWVIKSEGLVTPKLTLSVGRTDESLLRFIKSVFGEEFGGTQELTIHAFYNGLCMIRHHYTVKDSLLDRLRQFSF
jgi:hypothetical protein